MPLGSGYEQEIFDKEYAKIYNVEIILDNRKELKISCKIDGSMKQAIKSLTESENKEVTINGKTLEDFPES